MITTIRILEQMRKNRCLPKHRLTAFAKLSSDRYLDRCYRRVSTEPIVVKRICEFLDIPASETLIIISYHKREAFSSDLIAKKKVPEPIADLCALLVTLYDKLSIDEFESLSSTIFSHAVHHLDLLPNTFRNALEEVKSARRNTRK